LEAYFQHLSRSVSVHARGAGADYHTMRGDWFDLVWNFKALVRAKKIPDPGTSWLWLVDMASQAFSDLPAASAHAFFRAWQPTNTGVEPTLNRGIYPEAVATVLRNGSTVSELISPADQRRVLQFPKLMASGDVLGIEGGCWSRCAQGLAAGAAGGHRRRGSCCHGSPRPQRR